MDGAKSWQEDYRREVEKVLSQPRPGQEEESPHRAGEFAIPPGGPYHELKEAQERLASLLRETCAQLSSQEKAASSALREAESQRALLCSKAEGLKSRLEEALKELKAQREARAADERERRAEGARLQDELERERRSRAELEAALKDATRELESQRAEAEAQRKTFETAAASLAAEKQRLLAHWDEEAKLFAQRQDQRAAVERQRARALAESRAAIVRVEETLADMASTPAPAPELPKRS